ncbi:MAG: hypothetical protein FWG83_03625 [Oscillospiraceae bacterium]|nr:hypothetical protein [Oscillospiraceae bacterium]
MKSKARKLLSLLMTLAMFTTVLTMTACKDDDGTATTTDDGTTGTSGGSTTEGENNNPDSLTEPQEFDFGVVKFSSRDFTVRPDGMEVKLGGNMSGEGGGGEGAIRIFGFQGYPRPNDGFPDYGDGSYQDVDGLYQTLVSQNGSFWESVSKIEASFYLVPKSGELDTSTVGNVQAFIQPGGIIGFGGYTLLAENLLEQVVDDETPFEWGAVMTATWDINAFKATEIGGYAYIDDVSDDKEYAFDQEVNEEGLGGGVNKFGVVVQNDGVDEIELTIHWTDVKIYVNDKAVYDSFVDEVLAIEDAARELTDNIEGKVIG